MHGYLSSKEAFAAQIAYFSRFYRVTAIDFIGFGESAPLKEAFSVGDYAEWTREVLSFLDVKTPHVIAHSFGCRVAVKMAGDFVCDDENSPFDKILLTGPAGVILNRGFSYHVKVCAYRAAKKIAPTWSETHFGSQEYRTLSSVMKESYKKIVNEDLRDCAQKIKNQVLIVEGEEDETTPMREAQAYLRSFPNGRLCVMNGGHFAFAEYPAVFNMIAEEFLDG